MKLRIQCSFSRNLNVKMKNMPLTFSHIFLDLSHLKQKFKVSYLSKHSDVSIILQRVVNICTAFNSQETWVIKMLWLVHFIKQMFWDVCFYIFIIEMLWIVNFFITVYNVYFESLIFKVQILLTRPFYNKHNLSCPFLSYQIFLDVRFYY
jgi:hypothetical protein